MVLLAVLIAVGAVYFANMLTRRLAEEEKKKVELIRQALEVAVQQTDEFPLLAFTIIHSNETIPLINTDDKDSIINFNNIDTMLSGQFRTIDELLKSKLAELKALHDPVEINIDEQQKQYVYYGESELLKQLRYYPYVLLLILFLFLILVVTYVSSSNRYMQDKVWVGMSKETAHQLGTPLTSLVAWIEYLEEKGGEMQVLGEMKKDVERLQLIADRFSKIGSVPVLEEAQLLQHLEVIIEYMQRRASKQITFGLVSNKEEVIVLISAPLFQWVIENLIRNALDAMDGKGRIDIKIQDEVMQTIIDVSDTGKGIPSGQIKKVFQPGFSTKKRGWGLGLSLSKRIINEYHHGEIFVKKSELGKGTTFRIILKR